MSDERQGPGGWTDEDPPPSPEELEQARDLAENLERALAGQPVVSEENLAAALMVRASEHQQSLGPQRRAALVEEAVAQAARTAAPMRGRARRYLPALALAASLLLVAGSYFSLLSVGQQDAPGARRALPAALQSRSSDALMGRPFEDRAGASQRLDLVFADRLSGYRQIRFGERSRP